MHTYVGGVKGIVVGYFLDANSAAEQHAFLRLADGTITTCDAPGAGFTFALGINSAGRNVDECQSQRVSVYLADRHK